MFNNYNPYGFNNGNNGYQQRQMPMTSPQMYSAPSYLKGRLVTSIDEVRASQVDLDGTFTYFPSPAENKVYAKGIDMNGLPVLLTYELYCPNPAMKTPKTEQNVSFLDFDCRISALEEKIKEMENRESNANVVNA